MEKLKSRDMKLMYADALCQLWCVKPADEPNKKPIIFINSQMEHRIQAFETFTKITYPSCYQYSWDYEYDNENYTPYIFVYDYPITKGAYEKIDTTFFALCLRNALHECHLDNVDIIGQGVGGCIALRASVDKCVDYAISIHSPILSTPLVGIQQAKLSGFTKNLIKALISIIVDERYGFQQENKFGYTDLIDKINPDKTLLIGSSITGQPGLNLIEKELSEIIYSLSGMPNDGVVCWHPAKLRQIGYNVVEDDNPMSHFAIANNPEYTNNIQKKYLLTRK